MKIEIKKTIDVKPIEIAEKIGDDVLDKFFDRLVDFFVEEYNLSLPEADRIVNGLDLPNEEVAEILEIIVNSFKVECHLI